MISTRDARRVTNQKIAPALQPAPHRPKAPGEPSGIIASANGADISSATQSKSPGEPRCVSPGILATSGSAKPGIFESAKIHRATALESSEKQCLRYPCRNPKAHLDRRRSFSGTWGTVNSNYCFRPSNQLIKNPVAYQPGPGWGHSLSTAEFALCELAHRSIKQLQLSQALAVRDGRILSILRKAILSTLCCIELCETNFCHKIAVGAIIMMRHH